MLMLKQANLVGKFVNYESVKVKIASPLSINYSYYYSCLGNLAEDYLKIGLMTIGFMTIFHIFVATLPRCVWG